MSRKIRLYSVAVLAFILLNSNSFAQVVNVEKKRKGKEEGFTGIAGLGIYLIDNGKNIFQFKNNIDLQYHKKAHTIILLNDLNLMTLDDDNLVNSGFQHIRYNYTLKDSSFFTIEAFGQHQYNSIKLLKKRFLLGAGPRIRILNSDKVSCFIGAIGMYEYELRSDSLKTIQELARLSSYISFSWELLKNLNFNNITYYQPAFQNPDNYRIASESALNLKINQSLSFKIALQATYDSQPPEDVQKLFYSWQNMLTYEF
ncbi:MAG: DUF481 domain-containing protein [Bacteroidales bacterium]|nr:DUF481 domain-containing protein [Bacteroidales bacterium]